MLILTRQVPLVIETTTILILLREVQQIISVQMFVIEIIEITEKDIVVQILETAIRKEAEIIPRAEKENHRMVIRSQVIHRLRTARRGLHLHPTVRRQVLIQVQGQVVLRVRAAEDLLRAVVQVAADREAVEVVEIDN
jgi:hypothetical protein